MEYLHTPQVRRFSNIDMNAVSYNDLPVSFINWHKSIASIPPVKIARPLTGPFFPLKVPERFILKFKFSLHSFIGF